MLLRASHQRSKEDRADMFSVEFWNVRIAASGLRQLDTRIPMVPDQSDFTNQWFEWQQGYRVIKYESGQEERQTLEGENLADVAPGFLPRTLDQLRTGVTSNQVGPRNLNPTIHNVNTTAVDSPEFDPEDRIFDTPQPSPPRTNLYAPYSWRYPHRESLGWPYNLPPSNHDHVRRIAAIRTQLERIRLGIESVRSQLQELRGVYPASQYAIHRTSGLRTRMANIQNFLTSADQVLDPSPPVVANTGLNMDSEPMEWSTEGGLHIPNTGATRPATRPATSLQTPPGLVNTPRHNNPYLAPSFRIPPTNRPHPFGDHFTQHPATTPSPTTNSALLQREMNGQTESTAAGSSSTRTTVTLAPATPDNVRLRLEMSERQLIELRQRRDRARAAENMLTGRQRDAVRMMEIASTQREIAVLERQRAERRYDDVEQTQRQNVRVWGVQEDVDGQQEYVSPITSMFMNQSQHLRLQRAAEDAPPPPVYDPLTEGPRTGDSDRMMDTSPSPPPPDVRDPSDTRGSPYRHGPQRRFRTSGHGHNHQESESEDERDSNLPSFPSEDPREELLRRAGRRAADPGPRTGQLRYRRTLRDTADTSQARPVDLVPPRRHSPRSATAEARRLFSLIERTRMETETGRLGAVTADSAGTPAGEARRRTVAEIYNETLRGVENGHRRPAGTTDLNPRTIRPNLQEILRNQGLAPGPEYHRAFAAHTALRREMESDIRNTPSPRNARAFGPADIGRALRGDEIAAARAYLDTYRQEENKPAEVKSLDKEDDDRPEPIGEEQMMVKMECKICFAQVATVAMLPCGESPFPHFRHSNIRVMSTSLLM